MKAPARHASTAPSQGVGPDWQRRNRTALSVFGPLLVVTGLLGFVLPERLSLLSGATAYNLFHIVFGFAGATLALRGSHKAVSFFNLGFGLLDLWQALAGPLGIFPAREFALRPADHVVHAALGLGLCVLGARGYAASRGRGVVIFQRPSTREGGHSRSEG